MSTIPVGNARPGANPPNPGLVVSKKSLAVQVWVWLAEHSTVSFTLISELFCKITSAKIINYFFYYYKAVSMLPRLKQCIMVCKTL